MKLVKTLVSAAAMAALVGATAAEAQTAPCLTEAEVSGLVVYAMPGILNAMQTSCAGQLSAGGFLATGSAEMARRYAAKGDATWPQAKSAFFKLGKLKSKDAEMFSQLPDEAVRPLLDALIVQMVSQEIKPASCRNIERLVQVLDMLEPSETGALSGVIASLALTDNKNAKVCPARPS